MSAPEETSFEGTTSVVRGVPHCPDCPGGHILRVADDGYRVDCHEPADAGCRTVDGGCLVTEQAGCGDFAEDYNGPSMAGAPLDGQPITVSWTDGADGYYEWWFGGGAA